MDGIFMCYLEGAEREAYISEAQIENEFAKLDTLYEMCELKEDQMIRDIELKVLTESGTMDDYEFLLMEAEAEAGAEKSGIIHKIISAIGSICKSIKDAISKCFGKGKPDDDIEVTDTVNKISEFVNPINAIKTGVDKIKAGDYSGIANIISGISIPAVAVGGTAAAVTMIKKKRSEVEKDCQQVNNLSDIINNAINSLNEKINMEEGKAQQNNNQNTAFGLLLKGARKLLQAAKSLSTNLNSISKSLCSALGVAAENVKGAVNNAKENVKNAVKGSKDQAKGADSIQVKEKNITYYVFKDTGTVNAVDNNGQPVPVKMESLPKKVAKQRNKILANNEQAKRDAAAQANADPNAAAKEKINNNIEASKARKAAKNQQAQPADQNNNQQQNTQAVQNNNQQTQQNNGTQPVQNNNNQQQVDQNGNIIQRMVNGAKNVFKKKDQNQQTAQEAEELEEIRADLGEDYTVEMVEDEYGNVAYAITESPTIDADRFRSIFGYDPIIEESSEDGDDVLTDEEVADFTEAFDSLW